MASTRPDHHTVPPNPMTSSSRHHHLHSLRYHPHPLLRVRECPVLVRLSQQLEWLEQLMQQNPLLHPVLHRPTSSDSERVRADASLFRRTSTGSRSTNDSIDICFGRGSAAAGAADPSSDKLLGSKKLVVKSSVDTEHWSTSISRHDRLASTVPRKERGSADHTPKHRSHERSPRQRGGARMRDDRLYT